MPTGLLYDKRFLLHDTGPDHPETASRLTSVWEKLQAEPWFGKLSISGASAVETGWIETVHRLPYIRRAEEASRSGEPMLDSLDVTISEDSYHVARLAVGGTLSLGDRVARGELNNAFALIRPPGHHAEASGAMGFCLFNNIAILARYLQKAHGLSKVLILDWDVHHGNGTQHTFEEDPSVLYISLHQYPFYPGTGAAHETGLGQGRGATLNCPMPSGAGDTEYQAAFHEKIMPKIDWFKPEIILISAGFDAHKADPLAGIRLSTECFGRMTGLMMEAAERHAGGKIISLLEGGYNLEELPRSVAMHLAVLAGEKQVPDA